MGDEHKTVNPFEKSCGELWAGEVASLHVAGECMGSLRFSNMKDKGHYHVFLHLVHNPQKKDQIGHHQKLSLQVQMRRRASYKILR